MSQLQALYARARSSDLFEDEVDVVENECEDHAVIDVVEEVDHPLDAIYEKHDGDVLHALPEGDFFEVCKVGDWSAVLRHTSSEQFPYVPDLGQGVKIVQRVQAPITTWVVVLERDQSKEAEDQQNCYRPIQDKFHIQQSGASGDYIVTSRLDSYNSVYNLVKAEGKYVISSVNPRMVWHVQYVDSHPIVTYKCGTAVKFKVNLGRTYFPDRRSYVFAYENGAWSQKRQVLQQPYTYARTLNQMKYVTGRTNRSFKVIKVNVKNYPREQECQKESGESNQGNEHDDHFKKNVKENVHQVEENNRVADQVDQYERSVGPKNISRIKVNKGRRVGSDSCYQVGEKDYQKSQRQQDAAEYVTKASNYVRQRGRRGQRRVKHDTNQVNYDQRKHQQVAQYRKIQREDERRAGKENDKCEDEQESKDEREVEEKEERIRASGAQSG